MLHVRSLDEGLDIFKALGSEVRINIIKLLANNSMSMNELARMLNITNGALTNHIKKLEDCGLIKVSSESTGHGNQKKCYFYLDKILISLIGEEFPDNVYSTDVRIGQYSDFHVYPTCGLASGSAIIGEVDDPRYFSHPKRFDADIIWFTKGHVEYIIPNFIPVGQAIDQISLSFEISSEAPGSNDVWPSDISFFMNNEKIATWTSPGDFGSRRGIFTPDWWEPNWNQYGLLKILVINKNGTFIDGLKYSDISLRHFKFDYRSTIKFKVAVENTARHIGGVTLFGMSFGNYSQDISVRINYSPLSR